MFRSDPTLHTFYSGSQKSLNRLTNHFPHFYIVLYIIELVLILNIAEIQLTGR